MSCYQLLAACNTWRLFKGERGEDLSCEEGGWGEQSIVKHWQSKRMKPFLWGTLQKHEEIINPITKPWFLGSSPSFYVEDYSVSSKTVQCLWTLKKKKANKKKTHKMAKQCHLGTAAIKIGWEKGSKVNQGLAFPTENEQNFILCEVLIIGMGPVSGSGTDQCTLLH